MLLFIPSCFAQTSPHITSVVSAADFNSGVGLGGIGSIFGTGLSDGTYQFSSTPYPTQLGPTQVFLCLPNAFQGQDLNSVCQPLGLTFASPDQINFLAPDVLATSVPWLSSNANSLTVVAAVNGVIDDPTSPGEPACEGSYTVCEQNLGLTGPEPRIFFEGYDCFIDTRFQDANKNCGLTSTKPTTNATYRGAVTDQQGVVLSSANPARIGQYYTLWMTGLGPFTNGKPKFPFSMNVANVPGYADDTAFDACGIVGPSVYQLVPCPDFPIDPTFVGPSPQFPGLYQVNFQLPAQIAGVGNPSGNPPLFPCGAYHWEVSVEIEQRDSSNFPRPANLIQIPILVEPGDVQCASN
jgi:hypothetical protein